MVVDLYKFAYKSTVRVCKRGRQCHRADFQL